VAIKLDMLRVFRTVAEQGTLNGAADILGRTPSAISMMLAQLESELGAPLFETERKNRLSQLGELVLDESVRATDTFARSADAIRRHVTSAAGTVRIAAVPSATVTLLPAAIAAFRRNRPQVRLEISDVDSASVRRRIRFHEADIGIVTGTERDGTDGTRILRDRLSIVHHEGGAIAKRVQADGERLSWALLDLEPMISNPLCGLVAHASVAAKIEDCQLEARNTTALLTFVREGLGATILPESVMAIRPPGVVFTTPEDPVSLRELQMIKNPDRRLSPVAEAFWRILQPDDATSR
jgi:DNA-binding transcriptional LysR family regulator